MIEKQEAKERFKNIIDRIYSERGICDRCKYSYHSNDSDSENLHGFDLVCSSPKFTANVRWDDYCWQFKEDS